MCGYPTIKPDRVIGRIFNRLGLVENPNDLAKICAVGDEIAKKTGFNHKRIDIVLVKYGAEGFSEIFGLTDGVCSETAPKCDRCYALPYCNYPT
jgi:DNA-3-methyladenine glycosylase I